jgi:hypothetical protein
VRRTLDAERVVASYAPRGGDTETVRVEEVTDPLEAGRILKLYTQQVPIVRPYFDASSDAPVEACVAEVGRHPVFRALDQVPPFPTDESSNQSGIRNARISFRLVRQPGRKATERSSRRHEQVRITRCTGPGGTGIIKRSPHQEPSASGVPSSMTSAPAYMEGAWDCVSTSTGWVMIAADPTKTSK